MFGQNRLGGRGQVVELIAGGLAQLHHLQLGRSLGHAPLIGGQTRDLHRDAIE